MEGDAKRGVYSIARSMLPQHFLRRAPHDPVASSDYDIEQHLNMSMFEDDDGLNEELDIDMDQFHMDLFSPQQGIQAVVPQQPKIPPLMSPTTKTPSQATSPQTKKKRKNESGLGNYKFGRTTPIQYPPSLSPGPNSKTAPTYLPDFNPVTWDQIGAHTSHKLVVQDLPPRSRVETQINLSMFVYPPPPQNLVHLPTDTISKPKLQLRSGFEAEADVLMLETVVVCHSNPRNYVNICSGCMNRERKRASRKKVRVPIDEAHWNCDRDRRAIIFNCKEIVELSAVTTEGGVVGRRLDLPMRIACYCRHHSEELGFVAYISLRDHTGRVVAQTKTTPIMITDDHKALADSDVSSLAARVSSESQLSTMSQTHSQTQSTPITQPPSPDDASSTHVMEIDTVRTTKKRKSGADDTPYSMSSTTSLQKLGSVSETSSIPDTDLFTSVPSSTDFSESYTNMAGLLSGNESSSAAEEDSGLPAVKRLIPSQGSIRGGMEITLLGQGFHDGLVVKFGDNFASTQCWSDTTIVAQLPATEVAGPVIVSFSGIPVKNPQVFTYIDDTDRQLIELALQVVGLKMNGKLEDAKDIARRLIGGGGVNNVSGVIQQHQNQDYGQQQMQLENEVMKLLSCCDVLPGNFDNAGLNFANAKNQSLVHLAAGLGFTRLVVFLTSRGAKLNTQDDSGFTPLHCAALRGKLDVVTYLASQNVNLFVESKSGHYALDIAEEEIRSYLMDLMYSGVSASSGDSGSETEVPASTKRSRRHRRRARGPRGIAQYMYDLNSAVWSSNMGDLYDFIKSPFKVADAAASSSGSSSESSASPTEHAPPKYEDIFPEGSKVPEIDYSSSVIEAGSSTTAPSSSWDRKEHTEVSATPSNTPTDESAGAAGTVEMSEEEVMEAWKSKRTLLHQDIMFFLFWLPIFVALMYWAYATARTSLMGYSSSASWDVKSMKDTFLDYTLHVLIPKKHIHKVKWLS